MVGLWFVTFWCVLVDWFVICGSSWWLLCVANFGVGLGGGLLWFCCLDAVGSWCFSLVMGVVISVCFL